MDRLKLHDLRCFDAVATQGSFQAAGQALNRSHPSVFAAVGRVEAQLGLTLFDRGGYRVQLTDAGRAFHARAQLVLREMKDLQAYADQIASGEETILRIVMGDLCPRLPVLDVLSAFFAQHQRTHLHLDYEAVGGPLERLLDDDADMIVHRAEPSDPRLERIDLCDIALVPVVAPGFLPFAPSAPITPDDVRRFTQCVIRDTARQPDSDSFFIVEGANHCSVPDHHMKKDLILHRLAWGHLPSWLIENELRDGRLISIAGQHLPGRLERLAVVRRRRAVHGPVMQALWLRLTDFAPDCGRLVAECGV